MTTDEDQAVLEAHARLTEAKDAERDALAAHTVAREAYDVAKRRLDEAQNHRLNRQAALDDLSDLP